MLHCWYLRLFICKLLLFGHNTIWQIEVSINNPMDWDPVVQLFSMKSWWVGARAKKKLCHTNKCHVSSNIHLLCIAAEFGLKSFEREKTARWTEICFELVFFFSFTQFAFCLHQIIWYDSLLTFNIKLVFAIIALLAEQTVLRLNQRCVYVETVRSETKASDCYWYAKTMFSYLPCAQNDYDKWKLHCIQNQKMFVNLSLGSTMLLAHFKGKRQQKKPYTYTESNVFASRADWMPHFYAHCHNNPNVLWSVGCWKYCRYRCRQSPINFPITSAWGGRIRFHFMWESEPRMASLHRYKWYFVCCAFFCIDNRFNRLH